MLAGCHSVNALAGRSEVLACVSLPDSRHLRRRFSRARFLCFFFWSPRDGRSADDPSLVPVQLPNKKAATLQISCMSHHSNRRTLRNTDTYSHSCHSFSLSNYASAIYLVTEPFISYNIFSRIVVLLVHSTWPHLVDVTHGRFTIAVASLHFDASASSSTAMCACPRATISVCA